MSSPQRHPIPAVIAVLVRDGQVLLVRRSHRPDRGLWGFPGGKIELGETAADAALRELQEETGVVGAITSLLDVVDVRVRDEQGTVTDHYVLLAFVCRWISGEAVASDDAEEACWFTPEAIEKIQDTASDRVYELARRACEVG